MASPYTVKVHLEPFLKAYLINFVSKNKCEPIIFTNRHYYLVVLFDFLISKREYEFRLITEKEIFNDSETLEIQLPWNKHVDIRTKHYLSPKDEKNYNSIILHQFYAIVGSNYAEEWLKSNKSNTEIFDELAIKYGFSHEIGYERIKKKIYRRFKLKK